MKALVPERAMVPRLFTRSACGGRGKREPAPVRALHLRGPDPKRGGVGKEGGGAAFFSCIHMSQQRASVGQQRFKTAQIARTKICGMNWRPRQHSRSSTQPRPCLANAACRPPGCRR